MTRTILYSSRALIPSRKANSIHIMKMCSAFADNGCIPILLCHYDESQKGFDIKEFYGLSNRVKIIRIPNFNFRFSNYLVALFHLYYYLKHKPSYVFGRFFLGVYFISFFSNRVSLELHQPLTGGANIQNFLAKNLFKKKSFKNLIVISNPLRNIFKKIYKISTSKIKVFSDAADNPSFFLKNKFSKHSKFNVGYVGHLYHGRGIDLILELAKELPQMFFHIAGGNEADISRVRNESKNLKNVKIYGFITPNNTEKFRQKMNVLLAPYQFKVGLDSGSMTTEKWMSPLKIFEYMASGRVIICSDIPVLREVLVNNYNCILCHPKKVFEWKKSILSVYENKDLFNKLSNNSRFDFLESYSWKSRAESILKIL